MVTAYTFHDCESGCTIIFNSKTVFHKFLEEMITYFDNNSDIRVPDYWIDENGDSFINMTFEQYKSMYIDVE